LIELERSGRQADRQIGRISLFQWLTVEQEKIKKQIMLLFFFLFILDSSTAFSSSTVNQSSIVSYYDMTIPAEEVIG
jgi:hypothetical protein